MLKQEESALAELTSIENDEKTGAYKEQARFKRGDVYFKMEKYDEAMKEYAGAIKAYPQNMKDSPNAYYNTAEALFRQKQYKKSLDQSLLFLKKFPDHQYASYAMHRVANNLEILGAPAKQVMAAYIEDYYRYRNTPASFLAKLKTCKDK